MNPPETGVIGEVELEVRYAETDQMGVVHHANYLVWLELARTRLCAESGLHYAEIERLGHYLMVTGASLKYRQGARYGDQVRIRCWISRMGSRNLHFDYRVLRGDDLLATGRTEHIWVRVTDGKPTRIPASLRESFEHLVGSARSADSADSVKPVG